VIHYSLFLSTNIEISSIHIRFSVHTWAILSTRTHAHKYIIPYGERQSLSVGINSAAMLSVPSPRTLGFHFCQCAFPKYYQKFNESLQVMYLITGPVQLALTEQNLTF
jgi:hypothetical protein